MERTAEPLAPSRPWPWRLTLSFALVTGVGIVSLIVLVFHPAGPSAPVGELRVQADGDGSVKLEPRHPLSCFVNGRSVGKLSLRTCARRNGVRADRWI